MISTAYRIIGFGVNEHGFFNCPRYSSNQHKALLEYSEMIENPEMDGAVLIEVQHEAWKVLYEFGTYPYSVVSGGMGLYRVERSPMLVMV